MDKKWTKKEVRDLVQSEGLSYALKSYLNPELIKDSELRQLWFEAQIALDNVRECLKRKPSKRATELEFLKYFYDNADFGPAHEDVIQAIKEDFVELSGKDLPEYYEEY